MKLTRQGASIRLWRGEPWDGGPCVKLSWSKGKERFPAVGGIFSFGGIENIDVLASAYLGLANVYLSLQDTFPPGVRRRVRAWAERRVARFPGTRASDLDPFMGDRATGAYLTWTDELTFRAFLWKNRGTWSHTDHARWPWNGNGWETHLNLEDAVLGKREFTFEQRPKSYDWIEMPEGRYPAMIRAEHVLSRRSRGRAEERWRAEVVVPMGVPIPGKGENAHDLEDDALYSVSCGGDGPGPSPEEIRENGIIAFSMKVLSYREILENILWKPTDHPAPPDWGELSAEEAYALCAKHYSPPE